ncbi:MAG: cupin domain-containing protein [Treponema sp.]|nr:cupin domain-containing protein [Treponema sp.]
MLKEKIGSIFSIKDDNTPVKGCTISKTVYEDGDFKISYFALAAGTDISAEAYTQNVMYLVLSGNAVLYGKKIMAGEGILIPHDTLFAVTSDTDCVYTEILFRKEFAMNAMKSVNAGEVFTLKDLVPYQEGKIVNRDIAHDDHMKLVVMSFDKGTSLTEHAAPGEALIFALDGKGIIGYEGKEYPITAGENFAFAKNGKHSVRADEKFKMALLVLF